MRRLIFCCFFLSLGFSQALSLSEQIELALFKYENEYALQLLDENKENISIYRQATFRAVTFFNLYFRSQPAHRNKAYIDSMLTVLEPTLRDAEKISDAKIADDWLMLGGAYGFVGMAEFIKGNRVTALRYASKAKGVLDDLVKVHPETIDAYFGIGVYNFALGQPPAYLRFLLMILGFSGDTELGFKQITRVAKAGKDTRVQSILFLINHSLFTSHEYSKTYPLLQYVPKYLQETPMFLYKKIQLQYYTGRYKDALETWKKSQEIPIPAPYIASNLKLYAARTYIALKQYDIADSLIHEIENTGEKPVLGFAYEIMETKADKFFALEKYKEAHNLYLYIYNITTVDYRKDRVEGKLEAIEEKTDGKLSY
jgi:hypothetical protein